MSVAQYFEGHYGYRLQYPHLPCIVAASNKAHLPLEVRAHSPGDTVASSGPSSASARQSYVKHILKKEKLFSSFEDYPGTAEASISVSSFHLKGWPLHARAPTLYVAKARAFFSSRRSWK